MSTTTQQQLRVDDITQFVTEVLPERKMLLSPFITEKSLGMFHAWRGVGKTHIALGIAIALASGGSFLKWRAPEPSPVLYVDGEMAQEDLQLWMQEGMAQPDVPPIEPGMFTMIAADRNDRGIPSLTDKEGQAVIEERLAPHATLFLDNISTLFRGTDEKEGWEWDSAQEWLIHLRQLGHAVILLHHDGKGGLQRGTSKHEDVLNWVGQLKHPSDYQMEQGLRCEVHFKKARRLHGVDARPFECSIIKGQDGKPTWAIKEMVEAMADTIRQLHDRDGESFRDISKALGISKSRAERLYHQPAQEVIPDVGF